MHSTLPSVCWQERYISPLTFNLIYVTLLQTISVPEGGELMKHFQTVDMTGVMQGVEFEGIYNRDSIKYIDLYKIPEVHTLLRGSLRYKVSDYHGLCYVTYRHTGLL